MKVGVTGSSGFVGTITKNFLLKKNINIIEYKCDLSNASEVHEMFSNQGFPDVLIHLAGRFSQSYEDSIKDNLNSTINLVNEISSKKIHLIFSSTGAVYGDSGSQPIDESFRGKINTSYGLIKSWCEQAIVFHSNKVNFNFTILRLPSIYGKENTKGIIHEWLKSTDKHNKITIHGDGNQHRSFINAYDVANAIYLITVNSIYGTYNLSHHENYSLNELASIFNKVFGCKIESKNADPNNMLQSMVLDSSKLYKKLNYKPSIDIKAFLTNQY